MISGRNTITLYWIIMMTEIGLLILQTKLLFGKKLIKALIAVMYRHN